MFHARFWAPLFLCCAVLIASSSQSASAATLCVNPTGSHGCYSTISAAVAHAAAFDVINVGPGTYKEDVVIGMPLSLIGAGAGASIIDATGLANGIFVDGFDNAGLGHVNIAGFTVKNANWEGVLVVSASDVVPFATAKSSTIPKPLRHLQESPVLVPDSRRLKWTRPAIAAADYISSASGIRPFPEIRSRKMMMASW